MVNFSKVSAIAKRKVVVLVKLFQIIFLVHEKLDLESIMVYFCSLIFFYYYYYFHKWTSCSYSHYRNLNPVCKALTVVAKQCSCMYCACLVADCFWAGTFQGGSAVLGSLLQSKGVGGQQHQQLKGVMCVISSKAYRLSMRIL